MQSNSARANGQISPSCDVRPIRPPLKPAAFPFAAAAAELGLSVRRIRGLVFSGHLATIGIGRKRQIVAASLERERDRRARRSKRPNEAEICSLPVATCGRPGLVAKPDPAYSDLEMIRPPRTAGMIAVLLPVSRAAAVVGLSDKTMRQLLERGEIPSVSIGPRRRVNAAVLERWAQGNLTPR